jgi:hypothetical protein
MPVISYGKASQCPNRSSVSEPPDSNKPLRDDFQPMLTGLEIDSTLLDETPEGSGVRLATMHRVKGLEFRQAELGVTDE